VGILFPDESNPQSWKSLRFREACNKVLHADYVDPETTAVTGGVREPLTGRLVLYGRYRRENWRTELDLKEYALSALALSPKDPATSKTTDSATFRECLIRVHDDPDVEGVYTLVVRPFVEGDVAAVGPDSESLVVSVDGERAGEVRPEHDLHQQTIYG
jgi:hypothetical protein